MHDKAHIWVYSHMLHLLPCLSAVLNRAVFKQTLLASSMDREKALRLACSGSRAQARVLRLVGLIATKVMVLQVK